MGLAQQPDEIREDMTLLEQIEVYGRAEGMGVSRG